MSPNRNSMQPFPPEFLALCRSVTDKRPKTVIDHILQHGYITTDELKSLYGYNHPPRAARDVREKGIPLVTSRVGGPDGRKIGKYSFPDPGKLKFRRLEGRTGLSKLIKDRLIEQYGCRCFVYLEQMEPDRLQIDHRVPYEVAGDAENISHADFMLLCASANRAKSWSCEHCSNWLSDKNSEVCLSCYWAYPEKYTHVALQQIRRIDLIWQGAEVEKYDALKQDALQAGLDLPQFVKDVLQKAIRN